MIKEEFLELKTDKIVRDYEMRVREAEQKAAQKEKAIAANMRSLGLSDDQISRVLTVK